MTNDEFKPTTAGKAGSGRLSRKLMVAASVSTVAAMLGVYGGGAQAQALPTGCISDGAASNQARAGDTVLCLEENDQPINGLTINVDDVTVNVGDAATPVDILTDGDGLVFLSSGDVGQRFTVFNSASTIYGANGVILNNTGAGGVTGLVEGSIDGGGVGVLIEQGGLGVVDLTVADVDNGVAINVLAGGGDVNFVSTGTVSELDANENAINLNVDAAATSNVALTLNNVVATTDGGSDGINADHDGVGDLTIVTNGAFTAYDNGFDIDRYGAGADGAGADGDITITTNGDVTTLDGDAFNIDHDGDGDITIVTNALVSAGDEGFEVDHDGTGDINITANGDLYSREGEIFEVDHDGMGDILIVTNGAVDSAYGAFDVNHDGTGDIVITTNGDINVTGGDEGVDVDHDGEGNISVTVNGAITVADDDAFYLDHDGVGDVVALVTGDVVSAGADAVELSSSGTANFDITVNGSLSAGDNGVEITSGSYHVGDFVVAVDGSITGDADADGSGDGVNAFLEGASSLTITTASAVSGQNGFNVQMGATATDLTINAGGDVTGSAGDGIVVAHDGVGDISINVADTVSGADSGVALDVYNTGTIDIAVNNAIGTTGAGIQVLADSGATDVSVSATGEATGGAYGVRVQSGGTGSVSVNVNDATGDTADGVRVIAFNTAATDMTILASGNVSGAQYGIFANHFGAGALAITTDGAIDAGTIGIFGRHDGTGDIAITANGPIAAGNDGVVSFHDGAGDISINAAGDIVAAGNGVLTGHYGDGDTSVSIASGSSVTAAGFGVLSQHNGTGDIAIVAGGDIEAGDTALAVNQGGLGVVTITADGDLTGGARGILVAGGGSDLTITTSGSVTGGDSEGINASQVGEGDLTIVATGDVTGGASGDVLGVDAITAINTGSGATVVDVSGTVNGVTSWGIDVTTVAGAEVIVRNGAVVTGPAGSVIDRGVDTTTILTLEEGGVLDGRVFFLSGDDVFNEQGGSFTTAFGGDGVDTVNFTGAARTLTNSGSAGDSLEGFEIFNFNEGGITLAGAHLGLTEANFNAGVTVLDGSLEALTATIADGAELNARDGAVLTGDLANNGVLNIGNSPGAFTVDGNVAFGSTSVFIVEVDGTGHDQLITTGDVTLGGTLDLRFAGGLQLGENTRRIIDAGGAISGAFDAGVPGENGLLLANELEVDNVNGDINLVTTVRLASDINGLNANQTRVGDVLINQLFAPDLDADFGDLIEGVGGLTTAAELGAALTDLTPEGFDIGLRTMTVAQDRFTDLLSMRANRGSFVDHDGLYAWTALQPFSVSQGADGDATGFSGGAFTFAAGVGGYALGPVTIGGALGFTTFSGDQDGVRGDEAEGSLFQMAASAMSAMTVAGRAATWEADLAFATGSTDLTMALLDPATLADVSQEGSADISSVDIRTRLTVDGYENGALMVRPFVAAGLSVYGQDATTVGAGATALEVEAVDATRAEIALGAEATYRMSETLDLGGALSLVQYMGDTEHEFASRFGAAATGGEFVTEAGSVSTQFQIDAGLNYRPRPDIAVSAGVLAEFGDLSAVGGSFRLSKSF